jgi:hypothetical protein
MTHYSITQLRARNYLNLENDALIDVFRENMENMISLGLINKPHERCNS